MNRQDPNCIKFPTCQNGNLMQFAKSHEKAGVRWTSS
jgi:hypothetical protein